MSFFYKTKIHVLLLILFILGMFFSFSYQKKKIIKSKNLTITEILKEIPSKDRKSLEFFFKNFVVKDFFGYVLKGKKPMCFSNFYNFSFDHSKKSSWLYFLPQNYKIKKGFDLWGKYKHLFPMKNYIIKNEPNPWYSKNELILFINKKRFVQIIENNIEIFQTILQKKIVPTDLLGEIEDNLLLKNILQGNEVLIGIVLGYGKDNAKIFDLKTKDPNYKNQNFKYVWDDNDLNKNILMKMGIMDAFSTRSSQQLENILLPSFIADLSSKETTELKNTYLIDRQTILDFYSTGDFLEKTLKTLTVSGDCVK